MYQHPSCRLIKVKSVNESMRNSKLTVYNYYHPKKTNKLLLLFRTNYSTLHYLKSWPSVRLMLILHRVYGRSGLLIVKRTTHYKYV